MKIVKVEKTVTSPDSEHFSETSWLQKARPEEVGEDGLRATVVHFPPGAHTHWHRHPRGQILYVMTGRGRIGTRGPANAAADVDETDEMYEVDELSPGDIVIAEPNESHWHGAAPESFMSHLSVTQESPSWEKPVKDREYRGQGSPPKG